MNLQETVSTIVGASVSLEEAREFADNEFGRLATFLREGSSKALSLYEKQLENLGRYVSADAENSIESMLEILLTYTGNPDDTADHVDGIYMCATFEWDFTVKTLLEEIS